MGWGNEPARKDDVNVSMVPLGTPLLAGPGAIAATIVFAKSVHHGKKRSRSRPASSPSTSCCG